MYCIEFRRLEPPRPFPLGHVDFLSIFVNKSFVSEIFLFESKMMLSIKIIKDYLEGIQTGQIFEGLLSIASHTVSFETMSPSKELS